MIEFRFSWFGQSCVNTCGVMNVLDLVRKHVRSGGPTFEDAKLDQWFSPIPPAEVP